MRRRYIRRVERALRLSDEEKHEIIRDLQEIFTSAAEHGETEEQVIARLGSPKEYVHQIHEQLGKMEEIRQRRKARIQIGILWLLAALLFLAGGIPLYLRTPAHVIGQADAMTQIQLSGKLDRSGMGMDAPGRISAGSRMLSLDSSSKKERMNKCVIFDGYCFYVCSLRGPAAQYLKRRKSPSGV